jgi:hypothetical protein
MQLYFWLKRTTMAVAAPEVQSMGNSYTAEPVSKLLPGTSNKGFSTAFNRHCPEPSAP